MTNNVRPQVSKNVRPQVSKNVRPQVSGDVFFFNAKDDFHATVKELDVSYTVHFTTDRQIETESFAYHASNPREFISVLDGIDREASPKGIDGNLALSLFYRLCFLIDEHMTQAYRPPDARMKAAEEYLRLHFTENDALARAVRETSLSARRFGTLFKAQYGTTPGKYLTALRIAAAKKSPRFLGGGHQTGGRGVWLFRSLLFQQSVQK